MSTCELNSHVTVSNAIRPEADAIESSQPFLLVFYCNAGFRNILGKDKRIATGLMIMNSKARSLLEDCFYGLLDKADYRARGEKPLALAALFEYCSRNKVVGLTISAVLNEDSHNNGVKLVFLELGRRCRSPLADLGNSWGVITGPNQELIRAITVQQNSAFSRLNLEEMSDLASWSFSKINFRRQRNRGSSQRAAAER